MNKLASLSVPTISAALVALLGLTPACKSAGEEEATGGKAGTATSTDKADPDKPKPKPSVRTKLETFRPLLAEPARAELSVGGVLIEGQDRPGDLP